MTTFTDDFSRADSTGLGAAWSLYASNGFDVSSNQAKPQTTATCVASYTTPAATDDHFSQATVPVATGSASIGVWCRGPVIGTNDTNTGAYYLFRWDGLSTVGLLRKTANSGSFTSLGTATVVLLAGDVLKITAVGSTIKGYVNGVEKVSVTDTNITGQRYTGLRSFGSTSARFDDFSGGDVGSGVTVNGGLASETDTASPGAPAVRITAALSTESDTALPGTVAARVAGTSASETDTALVGSPVVRTAGSLASTTESALPGAPATAIVGSLAEQVEQVFAGAVHLTVAGNLATESDLAFAGAFGTPAVPAVLTTSTADPSLTSTDRPGPQLTTGSVRPQLTTA